MHAIGAAQLRFCVLHTSHLAWQRVPVAIAGGHERRAVSLHSAMAVSSAEGCLCLQVLLTGAEAREALWFRPASAPELEVWERTLRTLLDELQAEARAARLHVQNRATAANRGRPIREVAHMGARNLRQRALVKLFYLCERPAPSTTASQHGGMPASPTAPDRLLLSLTRLPAAAAPSWSVADGKGFAAIVRAVDGGSHPFVLPVLQARLA